MGIGITSCGRSEFGNSKSDIEPRFVSSIPEDNAVLEVSPEILVFDTYCFSSWVAVPSCTVEISENGGTTYSLAFDGTNFVFPYAGTQSHTARPDSQRLRFYIQKTTSWPVYRCVIVRSSIVDEFGQTATKDQAVLWE